MKKLHAACVCAGLSFSIAACSPGTVLEQFTSTGHTTDRELTSKSETTTKTEAKDPVKNEDLTG
ncbi:hypothetical protein NE644_23265, partial [Blautia wexlerae]|nr:hypothetical protein [Blautia wexlerae]